MEECGEVGEEGVKSVFFLCCYCVFGSAVCVYCERNGSDTLVFLFLFDFFMYFYGSFDVRLFACVGLFVPVTILPRCD